MAKQACKCTEAEECECPEWIFTFADLVMLMMGLFVIMWVLKPAPNKPGEPQQALPVEVLAAIREAFGHLPPPDSKDPVDVQMLLNKLQKMKAMNGVGEGGKTRLESKGAEGSDPEVTTIRAGKQAAVGGRLLFETGDGKLTPECTRALDQIAMQIRGHRNIVLVKGHTSLDDFPDGTSAQQKMDLSLRRAQAVADYLTARGVEPDILRVQGCSTFEPVVQKLYTTNAQVLNRRAEVEATSSLVAERQDASSSQSPTTTTAQPVTRPVQP